MIKIIIAIRAIPCQGPPEIANWNVCILTQFFHKYFLRPWSLFFLKIIFINCGFFCIYIRIKVFFVLDVALLNATGNLHNLEIIWNNIPKLDHHHHHCCFHGIILRVIALNTAQKIKFSIKDFLSKCDQTVDFGTFTEGILNGKLHFLYSGTSFDVVLWNSCKSIIALTVVLFSTRILAFWPWICFEA